MSKDAEKFIKLDAGINSVMVGSVPLDKLVIRRTNYRKMNSAQRETLKTGIDKFGFQDLITVVKNEDGTYGIVDGHHRVDELKARGSTRVPVVLLPENVSKQDADLGMFSFNVSGEIVDTEFANFVKELMDDGVDADEIRRHATISEGFMKQLQDALHSPDIAPEDDDSLQTGEGGERTKKPKKAPDVKLVLLHTQGETEDDSQTMVCVTHATTVMDKEVVDVLRGEGITIEEISPIWFDNGPNLLEILARGSEE